MTKILFCPIKLEKEISVTLVAKKKSLGIITEQGNMMNNQVSLVSLFSVKRR